MTVRLDQDTHRYYEDDELFTGPSVTQALARAGYVDFRFVGDELRDRAMRRGTSVHWMLALHDQGALDYRRVPRSLRPYRKGWMDFRRNTGFWPDPAWIERSFISPLGYSGTIDRCGSFNGSDGWTLDIKTGDGSIDNWVRFQLSLYAEESKKVKRAAVKLRSDGTYKFFPFPFSTYYTDRAVALQAVRDWSQSGNGKF